MSFVLGKKSRANLAGVHVDLILVVGLAITISENDFSVLEGRRSVDRQRELLEAGKSKTMNSRHLTGHAVDLVPWLHGQIDWEKWHLFESVAKAMNTASSELGIPVVWGGSWPKFKDGPHYELLWAAYPATPDDIPSPARTT